MDLSPLRDLSIQKTDWSAQQYSGYGLHLIPKQKASNCNHFLSNGGLIHRVRESLLHCPLETSVSA